MSKKISFAERHKARLAQRTIGDQVRLAVNTGAIEAPKYKNKRHKEFSEMYAEMSEEPLSVLLTTRDQILADWTSVGEYESNLQLSVVECRIDKIRFITQRCGCPDPVPNHVRLDRQRAS